MQEQYSKEETIALTDVFAYFIRRLKTVIVFMVICAVILGGIKVVSEISRVQNASTPNNTDVVPISVYRSQLAKAIATRDKTQEYLDESLYMALDPYNINRTQAVLRLSVPEMTYTEGYRKSDDTRLTEIFNRIVAHWNSLDLSTALDVPSFAGVSPKFIRELLQISQSGDMLIIAASTDSSAKSEELVNAAYSYIMSNKDTILSGKTPCTMDLVSMESQVVIDKDILTTQTGYRKSLDDATTTIDNIKTKISDAEKAGAPETADTETLSISFSTILKQAVLGAIVGLVIAVIYIFCAFVFGKKIGSSKNLETNTGLTYLGNIDTANKGLKKLSNKVIGEYFWTSKETALDFVVQNVSVILPADRCKKLLVTSSLMLDADFAELSDKLTAAGYEVETAFDLTHTPVAIEKLKASDGLIMLEKPFVSKTSIIGNACELANATDVMDAGFVLI